MSNLTGMFGVLLVVLMLGAWVSTMFRSRHRDELAQRRKERVAEDDPDRDEIAEAIDRWDRLQTRRGRSQFWE